MTPGASIAAVLVVAALVGMLLSWRLRGRRQRGLRLPVASPAEAGPALAIASGLYLATTPVGRPLDRIVAGGLGFRARATATATARGLLLQRDGSPDLLIDRDRLLGIGTATWTIDRAVERDGLTVVRWRLGDGDDAVDVESSLRIDPADRAALAAALPAPEEVPDAGPADR